MNWRDYIVSDKEVLLGKPVIKGTRISIEHIVGLLAQGWAEQAILDNYPRLTKTSLQAVFSYMQDHLQDNSFAAAVQKRTFNTGKYQSDIDDKNVSVLEEDAPVYPKNTDTPETSDLDFKIVSALEKISEVFRILLWAETKENNLSPLQMRLITFLKNHKQDKQCTIAYIAKEFNLNETTIRDPLEILEKKGMIEQRVNSFSVTEKGKKLAESIERFMTPLDGAISALDRAQKENLLSSMIDLLDRLKKQGIIR